MTDTFAYTMADAAGAPAGGTVTMTISGANDAPQLAAPLPDQFGNQNAAFRFVLPDGSFTDIDAGDALSFSAALADGSLLPAWLGFDPLSRTLSGTPSAFDVGGIEIRVTAMDSAGASVSDSFTLSVSDASTVNQTHVGTRRRDVVVTGFANDLIDAGRGDDVVHAGAGRDLAFGGKGDDRLYGEAGNDRLYWESTVFVTVRRAASTRASGTISVPGTGATWLPSGLMRTWRRNPVTTSRRWRQNWSARASAGRR